MNKLQKNKYRNLNPTFQIFQITCEYDYHNAPATEKNHNPSGVMHKTLHLEAGIEEETFVEELYIQSNERSRHKLKRTE